MGDLDELLERTTIRFPAPMTSEKIQGDFFGYLIQHLPLSLRWSFSGFGYLDMASEGKRYLDKLNLSISRQKDPFAFASFEFHRSEEEGSFDNMRMTTYACDSLDEVMSLPSGSEQLRLTDEIRKATQDYFSLPSE